jgi:histone chaperone ASF1
LYRDSEESAPAEYPPEQPEADVLADDGAAYGAEEAELEAALIKELEEANTKTHEDHEMEGAESAAVGPEADDDASSEAGSEDLEAESSGSEDEDLEEEDAGEGDGEEDVEMADDGDQKDDAAATNPAHGESAQQAQHRPELMVH